MIGIDFGTTNTVVARMAPGDTQATPVRLADGEVCPSLVALVDGEYRFGVAAAGAEHVVTGLKNLLRDHRGRSAPMVDFGPERRPLADVLAAWFAWLLTQVRADLAARGLPHRGPLPVVLTVPQNCHDVQRRATRTAAAAAGWRVRDILNEPTAAALSLALHGATVRIEPGEHLAVWDCGGGTFDASLVQCLAPGRYREVDSEGVRACGGGDVDRALLALALERLAALPAVRKADWTPDAGQQARLVRQVEKAKIALASDAETEVFAVTLGNVIGTRSAHAPLRKLQVELERADLAAAAAPVVKKATAALKALLTRNAGAHATLAAVVLTGGSAGLPGVGEQTAALLGRLKLSQVRQVVSDRCCQDVAMGAAVHGAVATELNRRAPLHFGVWRTAHGRDWFHLLLPRGAELGAEGQELEHRYLPEHDVGEFRFVQCSKVVDACGAVVEGDALADAATRTDLQPAGDVLDYPQALRLAFDPALAELGVEALDAHRIAATCPGVEVVERYRCCADGLIDIALDVGARTVALTLDWSDAASKH